jgi:hypothetical protein
MKDKNRQKDKRCRQLRRRWWRVGQKRGRKEEQEEGDRPSRRIEDTVYVL